MADSKVTVLVVDDDDDVLTGTVRILKNAGHHVIKAHSGKECLEAVQQHQPDLVLLDVVMPDMEGTEVCRRIKEMPATPQPFVMLASGVRVSPDEQADGLDMGADAYLARPFTKRELLSRVDSILRIKQAESAIAALALRYQTLMQTSGDGIYVLDEAGNIEEANTAFCNMLGYAHEELATLNVADWAMQWSDAEVKDKIATLMRRPALFETQYSRKDGRFIDVEINSTPVSLAGRDYLYSAARDITERKRMAEALRAADEREHEVAMAFHLEKTESLGRMAGAIAHHFNNQLQTVMGNMEMVLDDLQPDDDSYKALAEAMSAAERASEMSTLMLTYLGQTHEVRESQDLAETCRKDLPRLQGLLPVNRVLESDLPLPGPIVGAAVNQIKHILQNLVLNAHEAENDSRSTIRISVSEVPADEISRHNRFPVDWRAREECYACLEVSDTGCGVKPEDVDKLFEPFFSSKFAGRGLGLSVVLGIVRAHDGGITVETEPDKGSVFRAYLPVKSLEPGFSSGSDKDTDVGRTIMVVDDEEMMRKIASSLLDDLGFRVVEADSGIAALKLFQEHPGTIHGVLCDQRMPQMGGWEVLAELRKLKPGIPVIMVSGYSQEQPATGDMHERPQGYLIKPFRREQLRVAMEKALASTE